MERLEGIFLTGADPAVLTEIKALLQQVLAEVRASRKTATTKPPPVADGRMLSPAQVCKRYAIGRRSLLRKIELGEIPAVRRERCRGGQPGWLLRFEDCESVFAKPDNLLIPAVQSHFPLLPIRKKGGPSPYQAS